MAWLYHKLCHDPGVDGQTTDSMLIESFWPLVITLRAEGLADLSFFLRYFDIDGFHLRLRIHSRDPARTAPVVADELRRVLCNVPDVRLVSAIYEPEIAKYGGRCGMAVAEEHFSASSDFALECINCTRGRLAARLLVAVQTMHWMVGEMIADRAVRKAAVQAYFDYWSQYVRGVNDSNEGPAEVVRAAAHLWKIAEGASFDVVANLGLSSAYDVWRARTRAAIDALRALDEASVLEVPPLLIALNLVHTFHNRLGLSIDDELIVVNLVMTHDDCT